MVRLADAIRSNNKILNKKSDVVRLGKTRKLADLANHDEMTTNKKRVTTGITVSPEKLYNGLVNFMRGVNDRVKKGERFDIQKGPKFINVMVGYPKSILDDLHRLTLLSAGDKKGSLSNHAANVSINSIIMGTALVYPRTKLIKLGTAALFHDIGMYRVPDNIINKKGRLTPSEIKVIRQHPEVTYNELLKYGEQYHWLAEVVYQEHERVDGSGYPRGLKGDQIHEHASIIGILDIYDAMIHNRPQRGGLSPAYAMKEIVQSSKGLFPASIIKHLLCQLSIFPVKSYVKLNNDSIGMVVKTNTLWPLKPAISLIYDAQGKRVIDDRVLDLAENPLLYIKDVIREEDIPDFF
ncbi:MAG: HD domain-containing phosphohydrolase [Pseudomonadota bacterium]